VATAPPAPAPTKVGALPAGNTGSLPTTQAPMKGAPILQSELNPPSPGNTAPAPLPSNPTTAGSPTTNTGPLTGLTFAQVENYWIQAGGSPQAAAMAAAVADAESGLNAAAQRTNPDGTTSIGLWLIPKNGTPPGSSDPLANARAAVQLSQNGTDWTQWCSTWSDNNCGQNNGTYLGQGANALMSLATQGGGYNVAGSTPTGIGTSASSASSGTSTTTSGSKNYLLIGALLVVVIAIIWIVNRKKAGKDTAGVEQQ
jgi:Lysozyme like domain